MFKKLIIFLLSANIITTVAVGYSLYKNFPQGKEYKIALDNPENKKFEENVYKAMSMLMQGQSQLVVNQQQLSYAIYRIHHFAKPHVDFQENCPECEFEKQRILSEEQGSVTKN